MPNTDTATAMPGRTGPPWTADGTVYFFGGCPSNFAPTPGLRLPFGYHGHHEHDRVPVPSVEHFFQACKATSREQFDLMLACGTAAAAKRAGRETELRPDWEEIKLEVMPRNLCPPSQLRPIPSGHSDQQNSADRRVDARTKYEIDERDDSPEWHGRPRWVAAA